MKLWQKLTDLFDEAGVAQEMSKRYKDTLLCIYANGKNHYATYRGLEDGFHKFRDKSGGVISLSVETEHDVFVPRLESGCYNTSHGAVHVSPIPARQWKRGLTKGNTIIINLMSTLSNKMCVNVFDNIIFEVLDESNQSECPLRVALAKAQQYGSYACNRTFSVMLNPHEDSDVCFLFYHRCLIATVEGDMITVTNPAFTQEIVDARRILFADYGVN